MSRRSRKIRVNNEYTTNEDIPNKDILIELLNNNPDGTIPFMNFLENTKTMFDNYEKLTKTMEVIQQQSQMVRRNIMKQNERNLDNKPYLALQYKTNDLSKSLNQLQKQVKCLANGDMLDSESSIKNMKPITTYFPLKKDLVDEEKEIISESNEKQEIKVEDFDIDKELMVNLEEMQQLSLQVKELVGIKKK
tara:strand:- start:173 stop:748 length:576 start_codon:yes stop_codon:yes gene_type:complete